MQFDFDFKPWLVVLSVALAGIASFTALTLLRNAKATADARHSPWLYASAAALGGGIWSMHFIGMLAIDMHMSIAYDWRLTLLSLALAVLVSGAGLYIVARWGTSSGSISCAGVLIGSGIFIMHYVGMAGMRMPGMVISYNGSLVFTSGLIALVASTSSLWLAFRNSNLYERVGGALLMGMALSGMHYTGIAAARFGTSPEAAVYPIAPSDIQSQQLVILVATATVVVLGLALIAAYLDRKVRATAARHSNALRQNEEALRIQNARFAWALNHVSQGLCMFDRERKLIASNRRFAEMYNLPVDKVTSGLTLEDIDLLRVEAGGAMPHEFLARRTAVVARGVETSDVFEMNDGRTILLMHEPLPDGGWVSTHQDITKQRKAEADKLYIAQHDSLTGLPNRALFREQLARAQTSLQECGATGQFAVLILDLDHFKEVNDIEGHSAGDALLCQVARRLLSCVRASDTVARIGGDEFAILLSAPLAENAAEEIATKIISTFHEKFLVNEIAADVGVSIGISLAPQHAHDAEAVLQTADIALYEAKGGGRGMFRIFDPLMESRLKDRKQLKSDIAASLERNEFEVFYQPIIDLVSNEVAGFEALVRWRHLGRGLVAPSDFIAVAEESGLIIPIGNWVLREACCEAAKWPPEIGVAVNLSSRQFRGGNLGEQVAAAICESGLAPERLELEITESVLLQENETNLALLHELRGIGVNIALDDFGTGYSSMSYLQKFPFTRIKIDRSFVSGIDERETSQAIVRSVISLGHSLGMMITAEGVETRQQLDRIRAKGCNQAQGYFFSRPVPKEEIAALLTKLKHSHIWWGGGSSHPHSRVSMSRKHAATGQ